MGGARTYNNPMANTAKLASMLDEGLVALSLNLSEADRQKLLDYVALLGKWNQAYNLTAVRDPEQMVSRHVLDSLAIAPHVKGPRALDIGTGPGLPGIPLAIARPEIEFVLLDSNAKKTRFVTQAVAELGLANVEVVQARVEKYRPDEKFDTLISRAFASIAEMLAAAGPLCRPGGEILAMKGVYPGEELTAIPPEFRVQDVRRLAVPGLDAARHLVIITPA